MMSYLQEVRALGPDACTIRRRIKVEKRIKYLEIIRKINILGGMQSGGSSCPVAAYNRSSRWHCV
jgi:hypothetical protein